MGLPLDFNKLHLYLKLFLPSITPSLPTNPSRRMSADACQPRAFPLAPDIGIRDRPASRPPPARCPRLSRSPAQVPCLAKSLLSQA